MTSSKSQTCCRFIPLSTGVLIITIFGILNKLSGFYGIISFDFSDPVAFAVYIYSLLAVLICAYGLYGLHTMNIDIVRWYTIFYWVDCFISTATTIWFATKWYAFTDHSLPELADNPIKQKEHDDVFRMESIVSICLLVVLRLIHFYFAIVITSYYRSMGHRYSKLSIDRDFE
ncbi:Inositolphosphorylceramide synthase subunit Kei1-domain-containing protein [Halteromyces radiatus]|uniref:Inositolphosphorylceramide synthase subunit Kei1-domain-containing protein n=1 Tax=Halteromyces radiatus TaxID=101107 RepID=UPI00221F5248|nr:Inositolphosphorylceramide synthase subunit Kei1-domain-containing protein [Halteromyces radiatus]KAI8093346.1 Inositolphosphorylceramide synthase subunit Kei1-domain-containing protein [Halteromyces radiatus]